MELEKEIQPLYEQVVSLIKKSRQKVAVFVNAEVSLLYWHIGQVIHTFVLQGQRATYGNRIIEGIALQLTQQFGSGWSSKHLRHCLRIAETFTNEEIISAVQRQLSWTHLKTIGYEKDSLKRQFYLEMAILERWNTRTLAEQMDKMLYERTAIAKNPQKQVKEAIENMKGKQQPEPDIIFKNSYILDFLGLKNTYSEKDLEAALIANLQAFIMELGSGFAFLERQKRIPVDTEDYHLDLLFYHRKLKRLVAIDLKLGKFKPKYKAQMELYLRYLQRYEMQEGEETPIGLMLCSEGNTEHIELLMLEEKHIRVAQYLTELPDKQWFADKLHKAIEIAKMQVQENKD